MTETPVSEREREVREGGEGARKKERERERREERVKEEREGGRGSVMVEGRGGPQSCRCIVQRRERVLGDK